MRVKLCEIVSNVEYISVEKLKEGLERGGIRDYAYILHDKDSAPPHLHIALRLNNSYDTKYIAEWFGVAENFVSKIKGRWSDMLKYLIHENAPGKFQYDVSEVISNFEWVLEKDTAVDNRKGEIIDNIVNGVIRQYNYFEHMTAREYDKYKKSIDNAYKYRLDKIKGVTRNMECIFITGSSGSGKTTLAKRMATEKGYSVYVSSGSNDVLDGYQGEDCIILDDLRPSCLGLSDLLKMLDNNTASTVKSRWYNKVLECKLIIITTVLSMEDFYKNVFSEESEPIIQFKRRCKTHVRVTLDKIYISLYQPVLADYGVEFVSPNKILEELNVASYDDNESLDIINGMFGDLVEIEKHMPVPDGFIRVGRQIKF